jgi:aspartyl-tRNA(Asn)/glutamyl-tRNA(Gln) amidotransferase subunit C
MTISKKDLQKLAKLSSLSIDQNDEISLAEEVDAILSFVENLKNINTYNVAPLFHPMDLHQRLRKDSVSEQDCQQELAELAPLFAEHCYLVPKVIDQDE